MKLILPHINRQYDIARKSPIGSIDHQWDEESPQKEVLLYEWNERPLYVNIS